MKAAMKPSKTKCAIKPVKNRVLEPKVKAKWLKALRSGKYRQTRGQLYNQKSGGYCCLGVLQHCIGGDAAVEKKHGTPTRDFYDRYLVNNLSHIETESIGYKSLKHTTIEEVLTNFNDSAKYNFNKIADWIEEYL